MIDRRDFFAHVSGLAAAAAVEALPRSPDGERRVRIVFTDGPLGGCIMYAPSVPAELVAWDRRDDAIGFIDSYTTSVRRMADGTIVVEATWPYCYCPTALVRNGKCDICGRQKL